jgi:16S rRNA (guanine(527)-N(7))-methyltransferase RsmG
VSAPGQGSGSGKVTEILAALGLDQRGQEQMADFLELIARWRSSLDLTGRLSEAELARQHIGDALAAGDCVPSTGRLLDIGSGVGLPAIPLLVARPGAHGVLLEPRERRWAFLREVIRTLSLDAEVVRDDVRGHPGSDYDVVTVRGVEPRSWASELPRLVCPGGCLAWWTGEEKAAQWERRLPEGRVIISPLPSGGRGRLLVWRRCFT